MGMWGDRFKSAFRIAAIGQSDQDKPLNKNDIFRADPGKAVAACELGRPRDRKRLGL
jgi:hypothetical protein